MPTRIIVLGHLIVDYVVPGEQTTDAPPLDRALPGGTAYNAATAFSQQGFIPLIVGRVGDDAPGRFLIEHVERTRIDSLIEFDYKRPTASRFLSYSEGLKHVDRPVHRSKETANDYDARFLARALRAIRPTPNDLLFVPTHFLARQDFALARSFAEVLAKSQLRLILDLVPHALYNRLSGFELAGLIRGMPRVLISELRTLEGLFAQHQIQAETVEPFVDLVCQKLQPGILVLRYGFADIEYQVAWSFSKDGSLAVLEPPRATGYQELPSENERRGFGDRLAAAFVRRHLEGLAKSVLTGS